MAKPVNYLDRFATYIYHFELHASTSWDTLKAVGESDANLSTTRKDPNGTLLINTRKDAHQHIDNVKFTTVACFNDPFANLSADGELSLEVDEPGGMCFAEKVASLRERYGAKSLTSDFHFGLKIFFVGRYPNNVIETIPMKGIIPLQLLECDGSFTQQGSKYRMDFLVASYLLSKNPSHPNNHGPQAFVQMNRNLSITALTCQEALKQLEEKFNDHYKMIFEKEVEATGGRKVTYKINIGPQLKGVLKIANQDDYAAGTPSKLTFDPNVDIVTMIRAILYGTHEIAKMIADSKDGVKKAFHPGVRYPLITPNLILRDGSAEVVIDVELYEGSNYKSYEFDYYFSDPGKNVDVMSMDIKFPSLTTWMNMRTTHSTAMYANNTSDLANKKTKVYTEDVIYPDAVSRKLRAHVVEKSKVELPPNAVLIPGTTGNERFDMTNYKYEHVPVARMAFASLTAAHGATEEQVACLIRGHLELLEQCNMYPDGSKKAFGTTNGIWVKVNVNQVVDGKREPFYYTGWYQLMTVDNVFSNGKFTQNLTLLMKEDQK